jgi:single-strand DNA-binding protein
MINQVCISGNLTADPELKYLATGNAVVNFTVAINSKYQKDGQWVEEVDFILVTAFGKVAENCGEFLNKGSKVTVSGKLKQDRWEDDNGKKQSKTKVVAALVEFMDSKPKAEGAHGSTPAGKKSVF